MASGLFRIANKTNGVLRIPNRFVSSRSTSKSGTGRVFMYGTFGTLTTVGGAIAYANYDIHFKRAVNEYIPGFAYFSTDVWNQGTELARTGWNVIKPIITPEKGNTGIQPTTPTKRQETTPTRKQPPSGQQTNKSAITETKELSPKEPSATVEQDKAINQEKTDRQAVEDEGKSEEYVIIESSNVDSETKQGSSDIDPKGSEAHQEPLAETTTTPVPAEPVPESTMDSDLETKNRLENELRSVFHDFILASDEVVTSLQKVGVVLNSHFSKIKESTTSPPENETDIDAVSECIGAMKTEVDEAYKIAESTKVAQQEISKKLSASIAEALNSEILEDLVEQICDKASEYEKTFEVANEDINKIKSDHKSWQEELEETIKKGEEVEKTPSPEVSGSGSDDGGRGPDTSGSGQLPLKDLDTQQEALLLMLRKRIEGMEEEERKRLAEALSKQKAEMQEEFNFLLQKQKRSFDDQLQLMEQEIDAHYEEKIKGQLFNQAEAYSKHLTESLQSQAKDLRIQFDDELSTKISDKDDEYHSSMSAAMAKLKGIHSVINMVAEAGDSTRRLQNVRTASDSLTTVIIAANNDPSPYNKHLINQEVESLHKAAQGDEFILKVLSAIPEQAIQEGISSETGLAMRFERVRKICKRVALVGEEGAGLGTYLLSYIQSLLTFDMIYDKMLSRDNQDIESMNTYRLLSRANSCLERGDLEMAVRLVNQLKGEPRRITQDWVKEACLYLETRQAVTVVSEYLSASSYTTVH